MRIHRAVERAGAQPRGGTAGLPGRYLWIIIRRTFDVNSMQLTRERAVAPSKERTARLTVLIDPRKKAAFERLCAAEDVTPSQVVRRLIREFVEARIGASWLTATKPRAGRPAARRSR